MFAVKIEITRYVEDTSYPGWVECRLLDAWGKEWLFFEKAPVVTEVDLDPKGSFPQPGVIACEIVERRCDSSGRDIVCINTGMPWGVETSEGQSRFEVLSEQVIEID
jgi:hypothetical protein